MSSLSKALSSEFEKTIRQRGLSYFQRQLVKIKKADQWSLTATVRGSSKYEVSLKRDGEGVIAATCTCPYVNSSQEPCKHLYAAVLAAEDKHFLQGDGDNSNLILELEVDDDYEEYEDEYDYDDDEDEDDDEPIRSSYQAKRRISEAARQRIIEAQKARWGLQSARKIETVQPVPPPLPTWKQTLTGISKSEQVVQKHQLFHWPAGRELIFIIDLPAMQSNDAGVVVETHYRERVKSGDWGKLKTIGLRSTHIPHLPDPIDRQVLTYLLGGREFHGFSYFYGSGNNRYQISEELAKLLLPLASQTGRCLIRRFSGQTDCPLLQWKAEEPYEFWLDIINQEEHYQVTGSIRRASDQAEITLQQIVLISPEGLIFTADSVAQLANPEAARWLNSLRQTNGFKVPVEQGPEFLESLLQIARRPKLKLPEELHFAEITVPPQPGLLLKPH
jgi:hypothetical protein